MPLLDSFTVDHTKMTAPAVRKAKSMTTPSGDIISVYDLRFCKPNKEKMSVKGTHTLEHLFAGFMRNHLNGDDAEIIDISPMGCRTGFYMSLIGRPPKSDIIKAWKKSMKDVLKVKSKSDIPELNKYQCGSYKMHSLKQAKKIARQVLKRGIKEMCNKNLVLSKKEAQGSVMLILIPVDDTNPKLSKITKIYEADKWALIDFDEGVVKKVDFFDDRIQIEEPWIDFVVLANKFENYMDFMNEGMMVLCVREEETIKDIIEAFKFKELDEVGF